jgi:hypothetical protein
MENHRMARPLLLLDVDGVLNPYGAHTCPPGFTDHDLFPGEEPVRINPDHGPWIIELATTFDVTWATGWNDHANHLLAPLLRIPTLPVLAMPPAPFLPADKVGPIAALSQRRPAAWIDDLHTPEALAWRDARPAPTLLITTDPAVGLTRESVDRALTWARNLPPVTGKHHPGGVRPG